MVHFPIAGVHHRSDICLHFAVYEERWGSQCLIFFCFDPCSSEFVMLHRSRLHGYFISILTFHITRAALLLRSDTYHTKFGVSMAILPSSMENIAQGKDVLFLVTRVWGTRAETHKMVTRRNAFSRLTADTGRVPPPPSLADFTNMVREQQVGNVL